MATASRCCLYVGLCFLHWVSADVPSLMLVAATLLQLARERDLAEALGWAHYFRGCAFYQWNQLAAAEDEFVAVMHQRYFAHDLVFSQSAFGLASVYHARGADQRARAGGFGQDLCAGDQQLAHYGRRRGNASLAGPARGAVAEAIGWTAAYEAKRLLVPMTTFHLALVTRARILVHVATAANREEAALLLDELHGLAHTGHNAMVMIEVLALEAVLQDERGSRAVRPWQRWSRPSPWASREASSVSSPTLAPCSAACFINFLHEARRQCTYGASSPLSRRRRSSGCRPLSRRQLLPDARHRDRMRPR